MPIGDGKAKNVIEYLDTILDKGKATPGAISPLKISFTKVLQIVEGENWEETDIRTIDIQDYMNRFANLTMGRYSPESLTVYKSRVNKVLIWYKQFLDNPGWTPEIRRRSPKNKTKAYISTSNTSIKSRRDTTPMPLVDKIHQQPIDSMDTDNRVSYPYPLLNGELIYLSLPRKLTKQDAKRIAAFVEGVAIDESGEQ